ncbi:hypothetical protein [Bailinhaonella thermotolerans]|uniref:Uncharacterized protein n=1 Tax=Bailinhaonella thermotolerans TaxID=1070861 RepID=A0A3A4A8H3_9ACTN|nr:hypothetical protein [Bailinhaonella thermotolerans]RJL21451.1 hypothetical protein D5H75_37450 [Bailinhaonella thermotolerans]
MRFFRGLPAEARAGLRLERGERPLAHAVTPQGGHVVATTLALHLPTGARLPWETVERAQWKDDWVHVFTTDGEEHHVRLSEAGRLPEVLRERVTASIVVNRHVRLDVGGPEERGVRIMARRAPGSDRLTWTFAFDEGLDPEDPGLRAAAEQALEDLRRRMAG